MTARRTRLLADERRGQLVALGVAALVDLPVEELTMEHLSGRAGVSRALLFHYFGSKQGMQHEVVQAALGSMLHHTEPREELAPRERLRDTLERTVGFVREHGGTFRALVRGAASGNPDVRRRTDEARDEQAARVRAVMVQLGAPDDAALAIACRAWVALAEETLVAVAERADAGESGPAERVVDFLERSAIAVTEVAHPEWRP